MFEKVNSVAGEEIPKNLPAKYTKGLTRSRLFNGTQSTTADEVIHTQKRFDIEMEPRPMKIFSDYISRGDIIVSNLVSHPFVVNPKRFSACSIILQRAVLVSNPPTQTMYLRSYFHSTDGDGTYVNFVPRAGVEVSYESDTTWFPLQLTSVITEPASYVVLDVLTQKGLVGESVPRAFKATQKGNVTLNGKTYVVTRLQGVLSAKEEWPDLNLRGK